MRRQRGGRIDAAARRMLQFFQAALIDGGTKLDAFSTAGWEAFFAAEVAAAGALTGLVFVGLSINLSRILSGAGLSGWAAEALIVLMGTLIVSSLVLVPGQSVNLLGAELFIVGLVIWLLVTRIQLQALNRHEYQTRDQVTIRILLGQLATLPFIIAAISILVGFGGGLYWIVLGIVFSYVAALISAWVLLVEILR